MPRIATKNVREKPAAADGHRALVMTLWPRGIKKSAADAWYKEVGTPRPLIRAWKSGRISWPELRRGYLAHLKTPPARTALAKLAGVARRRRVTLLCICPDPNRCHRSLLAKELQKRLRSR